VLDLRLYRVTLLPFAALLAIAAFSLHSPPAAPSATTPAQSFDASGPFAALEQFAASHPERAPGSAGDDALAARLASAPPPDGLAQAGFTGVRTVSSRVDTTTGEATVLTVLATRPGTGAGIVLIADRGGSQQGGSSAALAPTAALLELASIYKTLSTTRPLTLVSTSGGASAMGVVAKLLPPGIEAAIVIGDIADPGGRGPYVVPWSSSGALAPIPLRRMLESAIGGALARRSGDVSLTEQMARFALPLTTGAQGPLGAAGIPSVLITADGESSPHSPAADIAQVNAFGQALLGVTTVLDRSAALPTAPTRDLAFGTQEMGGWAVRAVIGLLLLSLLGCALDVLARARRRRVAVGRWIAWSLSFAVPFALAGLFAAFLGASGLLPATPAAAVTPAQLPVSGAGAAALVSIALLFVLVWVLRAMLYGRRGARARGGRTAPEPVGAAAALLLVATGTAVLLWLANPYSAALLIVPAHLWLVVTTREHGRTPAVGALCLAVSLAPAAAVVGLLCAVLHVEPFALLWTFVLLVAGGGLSPGGLLLVSLTAGSFVSAATILLRAPAADLAAGVEVTVRGPLSYAGPGSLGGTDSALRR